MVICGLKKKPFYIVEKVILNGGQRDKMGSNGFGVRTKYFLDVTVTDISHFTRRIVFVEPSGIHDYYCD